MSGSRIVHSNAEHPPARHRLRRAVMAATILAAAASSGLVAGGAATSAATATAAGTAAVAAPGGVAPAATGMIDCNGFSHTQTALIPTMKCADLHGLAGSGNANAWDGRFYDNGHYIGHDEPSVTFLSSAAGSGDNVSWTETLSTDPAALPTVRAPGYDVTHNFELTAAPWFGLSICDPNSYPQLNCTPNSDSNAPAPSCIGANPCHAFPGGGSAFEELQFYPPGFAPFADAISCDNTHWCAALTIDSLECTEGFANCNTNCEEPVNFAFLQLNGVPAGPPSSQLVNLKSDTPNSQTLLMNQGDQITASLSDQPIPGGGGGKALLATVTDATTGQTGYMQASAKNGFMHTSIVDCSGTPFNFEPEYSSAQRDNIVPWAALQGDIIDEFEIGHFEPCTSLSGSGTYTISGKSDPYHLDCHGPYETAASPDGGSTSPEPNDSPCYYKGDTHPSLGSYPPDEVTGCYVTFGAAGDLDFDGTPYYRDWPDSQSPDRYPSTFFQDLPDTVGGAGYAQYFFQTDTALTQVSCTPSGSGCSVPPAGPGNFYPFFTLTADCHFEFGDNGNGNIFGGPSHEYGTDQSGRYGYPEFFSATYTNSCG